MVSYFQLPEANAAISAAKMAEYCGGRLPCQAPPEIMAVIAQVRKYFAGEPPDFRGIMLDLSDCGDFARRVYAATRDIPSGQTRTYGEIAKLIGQPLAARAVGQALGRNPIALLIPCHRVLAASGKPGGFSAQGGLALKARMLAIEGVELSL